MYCKIYKILDDNFFLPNMAFKHLLFHSILEDKFFSDPSPETDICVMNITNARRQTTVSQTVPWNANLYLKFGFPCTKLRTATLRCIMTEWK